MKPYRAKTPRKTRCSPVRVYCRVRAVDAPPSRRCVRVQSSRTVVAHADGRGSVECSFARAFDGDARQAEVFCEVALPLVRALVAGESALLFAYGVTGSGKTYTMTGEPRDRGVLPRCLDALFGRVGRAQARRLALRPDGCNGFDAHADADARQKRAYSATRKNGSEASDESTESGVDDDSLYAVFVTYVEIYNNSVYDLLEDGTLGRRSPQSKIVREDSSRKMYVHGVTEVEVKTTEEALEAFYKGLKRKRMAYTTLNAESSRSHSVFTIRLVRAPLDDMGENMVQDKKLISVSQLNLVDLAGSERTSRTNNTGQRLREAGNINNSLMTLRTCLETLRENQQTGQNVRMVPYRDAKITHLFKNFFEGEGHVRMIVCVNPSCDDYDETLQVMRFAEVAKEVEVARPRLIDVGAGMTPGRRKANLIFKQAREKIFAEGKAEIGQLELDLPLVYSLGGDFPSLELGTSQADELIKQLKVHLELRLQRRNSLLREKGIRDGQFRTKLDELLRGNVMVNSEMSTVRSQLQQERQRGKALEARLVATEDSLEDLKRQVEDLKKDRDKLQQELEDKEMMLNQKELEKENQKKRFSQKLADEKEKTNIETQIKLWEQRNRIEHLANDREDRIKMARQILSGDQSVKTSDEIDSKPIERPPPAPMTATSSNTPRTSKRGPAVANPRHRRSLSADDPCASEQWIQHVSRPFVPAGTMFRIPKKPMSKVLNVKDITNPKTSNYCLVSQEQDTDGELETKLYKGNIVPTCGGGAQVILKDLETLKQTDAVTPQQTGKKREGSETPLKKNNIEYKWKKPRVIN